MVAARGPLRRTTPNAPRPGGVATATIVSSGVNTLQRESQRSQKSGASGWVSQTSALETAYTTSTSREV